MQAIKQESEELNVLAATEFNVDGQPEELLEPSDQQTEKELAIGGRLGNWKTILSFAFAIAVMAFAVIKGGIDPATLWVRIRTINLGLFAGAFVIYYLSFPLRGYRWKVLLQNAYKDSDTRAVDSMSIRGLTEIVYISWFVNCVVPAKLGDLYRAYLAKLWVHISWVKTMGTILAERIIDILVLSVMLATTGFIVFHNRLAHVGIILILGIGLAIAGIVVLIVMKTMSDRIRGLVPSRFRERYVAFEEGSLQSFRRLPWIFVITVVVWTLEGGRLQFVFLSLGIQAHVTTVPFVPMLFFALGTAVLTTIPFTPGGLGLVEVGLLSLMVFSGIPKGEAAAVVVVDRVLSYYSVAVIGAVVYFLSQRSHFRHPV